MNNAYRIDPDRRPARNSPTGHQPVRAEIHHDARQRAIRWPSEHRLLPARCEHCNAPVVVTDCPTAGFPTTDLTCFICSRVVVELVHDSVRGGRDGR